MRYIIIGAGAVGGTIGGRLAEAGHEVVLVARGAHFEALREHGLRLTTADGTRTHRLPVVDRPDAVELRPDDVLILAVKTQDSTAAIEDWAAQPVAGGSAAGSAAGSTAGELLPLVCAQNGVENERLALRRFRHVYGMCVFLPASYLEPGSVSASGAPLTGILHLGRYPSGTDETALRISADLDKSKLLAPVVPDVMRWKYAKLISNTANAIEAATGLISDEAAVGLARRAWAESRAVLAAAGIEVVSEAEETDFRDDKIQFEPLAGGERAPGSSWQSLNRGTGTIEADYLNGEIVLLGRIHGVPTPVNDTLQRVANSFAREGRRAGSMSVAELTALVDAEAVPSSPSGV